ncbi:GIY-YIG nuclease family protein [Flavobacterium sp. LM4]|uniref:GIY-YIG nuclease family protein n=1 Tax=Flavobacterium sp. LM4 TaxID=1938609 RepID=UPI000992BA08
MGAGGRRFESCHPDKKPNRNVRLFCFKPNCKCITDYTCILYSTKKSKLYIGQTNDIHDRIKRHNSRASLSTKNGIPWKIIYSIVLNSKPEAVLFEFTTQSITITWNVI